jgi:hypothetical protein
MLIQLKTGNQQIINALQQDLKQAEAEKQELNLILTKLKQDVLNGNKKTLKDLKLMSNKLTREKLHRKKKEKQLFKQMEKASKISN